MGDHKRDMSNIAVIILAAGLGTRMRSATPKVLHRAAGRSLLGHVLDAAGQLDPERCVVVTGADVPEVAEEARRWLPHAETVPQAERLGTAHAVSMAHEALHDFRGTTVILYGDVPLLKGETIRRLADAVAKERPLAVLGFHAADPTGYGRLILDADGNLVAIREELDASEDERALTLCNSGVMAVDNALLWRLLPHIGNDNAKGEYYLTDLVSLVVEEGVKAGHATCPEEEVMGVNDRIQLAHVEAVFQNRLRRRAMENGATLIDPASVFLSWDTQLGRDVTVEPWVWFGPGVKIGDGVTIRAHCHLEEATVADGAQIGPFARLRPAADVRRGVKIGNFVEIKKAVVEDGAKVNHFTYIGDARVGARANIGAGTITCNYDGFFKHFTDIGEEAFIGSNSALVAPVRIGQGAYVGSGSVITEDVAPGALALGRGRQVEKPGWAERFRAAMKKRKERGR